MIRFIHIFFLVLLSSLCLQLHAGDSVKKHIRKARKYRNTHKFEASENQYLQAIKADPTSFDAHFELGLLYEAAYYDPQKALLSFQKAEDVMKDTVFELFYHLGRANHYFENYDVAIRYYELFLNGVNNDKNGTIVTGYSKDMIDKAKFAKEYAHHAFDGQILNLGEGVNSGYSEYVPVFIPEDSSLLFTRRGSENLGDYYWDNLHYEDMYISTLKNGEPSKAETIKGIGGLYGNINNTKKHESVVDISPGGDTLILFIKNKLWFSIKEDSKWTEPKIFGPEINLAAYQRHACFSPDGNTLFFSSNADEGLGGLDIYTSKLENGEWTEATNLGESINTSGNEDAPFFSNDGKTLYFASTGHLGMGGYDLFMTELKDGIWSEPINLGTPINSPADDIYFSIEDKEKVYISSNRMNGLGKMDIYEFKPYGIPEFNDCYAWQNPTYNVSVDAKSSIDENGATLIYEWNLGDGTTKYGHSFEHTYVRPGEYKIQLNAIDSITGIKIHDEQLIMTAEENPIILGQESIHIEAFGMDTVATNTEVLFDATYSQVPGDSITNYFWKYNEEISNEDQLKITFDEPGSYEIFLEVISRNKAGDETKYCVAKQVEVLTEDDFLANNDENQENNGNNGEVVIDVGGNTGYDPLTGNSDFNLENIYFNFDKYNIRSDAKKTMKENIATLKAHPNVVIKVVGHTDAMGSNQYNMKLAENRAKEAVEYLVSKGIDRNRITAVISQGEEKPAAPNTNPDGSDNPTNRQKNRRVEFHIVGTLKTNS